MNPWHHATASWGLQLSFLFLYGSRETSLFPNIKCRVFDVSALLRSYRDALFGLSTYLLLERSMLCCVFVYPILWPGTRNINKGFPIVQSFQLGTVYSESSVLTTKSYVYRQKLLWLFSLWVFINWRAAGRSLLWCSGFRGLVGQLEMIS